MSNLEKYIHQDDDEVPLLIRHALIHYQFETIHPFPDGNCRVGRLLIPLILCARKEISQPLLYLSSFFERNYDDYVDHMLTVSTRVCGTVDLFFSDRSRRELQRSNREGASAAGLTGTISRVQRARSSALLGRLIDLLFEHPSITSRYAAGRTQGLTTRQKIISNILWRRNLRAGSDEGRPKLSCRRHHEILSSCWRHRSKEKRPGHRGASILDED